MVDDRLEGLEREVRVDVVALCLETLFQSRGMTHNAQIVARVLAFVPRKRAHAEAGAARDDALGGEEEEGSAFKERLQGSLRADEVTFEPEVT